MNYPEPISTLIECYKKLPGIGDKTAERMALYCLDLDQEIVDLFAGSLLSIKDGVKRCKKCNNHYKFDKYHLVNNCYIFYSV